MADTDQVLNLAAIIREVDGSNNKGAAALAESILDHPRFRAALADRPAVPESREPAAVTGQLSDAEGPSIEDVEELCEEHCFNVEGYESIECLQGLINEAIARWGNHVPAPPADGEVAALVAWLREQLHVCLQAPWTPGIKHFGRAAELIERLSTTQKELERERLRLAVCGVVAMADTPETAAKARDCLPEYWSASADDIARQIDKLMRLIEEHYADEPAAPTPPADGEVAEVMGLFRRWVEAYPDSVTVDPYWLTRAAELLEREGWALRRLHRLHQENARFREPERTILCDILANGTLLPDPDGKRYGVQPADGEVAELVEMLKGIAYWKRYGKPGEPAPASFDIRQADRLNRAAELLQRQTLVPVPVSERLPGPEDMTDDGEVWIEDPGHEYPLADAGDYDWDPHKWILRPIGKFDAQNGLRWLPAHALPVPEVGE